MFVWQNSAGLDQSYLVVDEDDRTFLFFEVVLFFGIVSAAWHKYRAMTVKATLQTLMHCLQLQSFGTADRPINQTPT